MQQCNKCGRILEEEDGILREECLKFQCGFGYFSRRDGEIHRMKLCEDCYDEWIDSFAIPVERFTDTELV